MRRLIVLSCLLSLLLNCEDALAAEPPPTLALVLLAAFPSPTNTPSPIILPVVTPLPHIPRPMFGPLSTMTPVPSLIQTSGPTPTPSTTLSLTPSRQSNFFLERPIAQGQGRANWVDRSYPYGGTQFGQREVHLGVEFFNPRFTPVLASAEGVVFYAGDDSQTPIGPTTNYYGRLVIIRHNAFSAEGLPIFTLYGHLQETAVETGQPVLVGQLIGKVGDSGIAEGPHLHFEVRVGDPLDYRNTRNPELYLKPYRGFGLLVGRVYSRSGAPVEGLVVLVRSNALRREAYVYGSSRVRSDAAWGENFTLGDLPANTYEVVAIERSGRALARRTVTLEAGRAAWVELEIE
ncbi:MAG: peptidoglycan DD-metalloendopeptidase family protein [Anaerolineae bacterium]|nr:peptidoglycan DD-metalloendopeptidase family protein [Anaerolineae bacterium]MDW8173189.1 peptidoglycan DD-metalloendopeptidase family protein [Anaerolineae bacterium]